MPESATAKMFLILSYTPYLHIIRTVPIKILVGPEGIGPSTSVLSGQRSATELWTHQNFDTGSRINLAKAKFIGTFYH